MYLGLLYKKKIPKAQWGNILTDTTKAMSGQIAGANWLAGLNKRGRYGNSVFGGWTRGSTYDSTDVGLNPGKDYVETSADTGIKGGIDTSKETKPSKWMQMQGSKGMQTANSVVGATAGIASGIGTVAAEKMKSDAGVDYEDIDKEIDEGKMKGAGALSGASKGLAMGASIGSAIPGVGTAIGAAAGFVIGGITGLVKGGNEAYEAQKKRKKLIKKRSIATMAENQSMLADKSTKLIDAAATRYGGSKVLRNGGKVIIASYTYIPSGNTTINKKSRIFKRGGIVDGSTNIIPNGVSHEEKNKLGTKGMPIIKCKKKSCEKIYEIESDELILTKEVTNKVEELSKNKNFDALGKFLEKQLLDNTHSYTDKYDFLN
jgi:hypothetical protein